jgi:hypothetical protein
MSVCCLEDRTPDGARGEWFRMQSVGIGSQSYPHDQVKSESESVIVAIIALLLNSLSPATGAGVPLPENTKVSLS